MYPLKKKQQYMWSHDYEKIINDEKYFTSNLSKEFNTIALKIPLRGNQRYDCLNVDISMQSKPFSSLYDPLKLENPVYISSVKKENYTNKTTKN